MAAAAQLTIAKAGLLAALLKPDTGADLVPCSREEIEQLHGLLSAVTTRCSPANVQKCKQWMLKHMVLSPTRTAAVAKYLVAFSDSQQQQPQQTNDIKNGTEQKPSAKRRRLHLLYIMNDLLFHIKYRTQTKNLFAEVAPRLAALFKSAAAFTKAPKHQKKLLDLVQLWQEQQYFSEAEIGSLRAAVVEGPESAESSTTKDEESMRKPATAASSASAREAPFVLPSMHGDASAPWYDLPAANWLPIIEPNSTRPMNPTMIKPLRLAGGTADKGLVDAVKKLLGDVDKIYAKAVQQDGGSSLSDVSQMGELLERDELGDVVGGETYYGWSRTFCEKMKKRHENTNGADRGRGRTAGSSRSDSRSRSRSRDRSSNSSSLRPIFKRRRLSNSPSRSRGRSRSRNRSRSRSRSRSGPSGDGATMQDYGWSRSRSRRSSRSRSYSPVAAADSQFQSLSRPEQQHNRDGSYSPPRAFSHSTNNDTPLTKGALPPNFMPPTHPHHQQQFNQPPPPPLLGLPPFHGGPFNPPPPSQMSGAVPPPPPPPNLTGWNVPPPPPPNFQGHWPPPPPFPGVPPPSGSRFPQPTAQGWFPPPISGISPPPPLAGHPQPEWIGGWGTTPSQPQSGGYGNGGRGGGGGSGSGYRGRGGYGRGRGW